MESFRSVSITPHSNSNPSLENYQILRKIEFFIFFSGVDENDDEIIWLYHFIKFSLKFNEKFHFISIWIWLLHT